MFTSEPMKRLLLLFLLISQYSQAQLVSVQGIVKDAKDKTALSFCSVAIKGTGKGTLTNEDGGFTITVDTQKDTLAFYYLGYKKKDVPASAIQENGEVLLKEIVNNLQEVTIRYDEERLYNILLTCKKQLEERKAINSKAYYQLETKINNDPVEMLECYYNARVKGSTIQQLLYKNGRVGLSKYDGKYFASMNTSRAIQYLDLTHESPFLPDIPLQQNKEKMMAEYTLRQLPSDETTHHIEFIPKKNKRAQFKGDIWIDKESSAILKIEMSCDSAAIHPFKADGLDKLGYVSMFIKHTYQAEDGPGPLQHIDFSYQFDYIDKYKTDKKVVAKPAKRARTKGVVYFYDFKRPFIAPYYKYDTKEEDYEKIAMLPYNASFWENAEGLMHTEEQQRSLEFLASNGQLMNFKSRNTAGERIAYRDFVEVNSLLWSDTTRIFLTRERDPMQQTKPYQLQAQIYMDLVLDGDSVRHFSVSVFDVKNTYFSTLGDKVNCLVNVYFDIFEIERLKMEDKLEGRQYTVEEIDEIYKRTAKNAERIGARFLEEVERGQNEEAMKKWNQYVFENLEIDNMKTFKLSW